MKISSYSKTLIILGILGLFLSCKQKAEDPSIVRSSKYKESLVDGYKKLGLFCASNMVPGLSIAVSVENHVIWADGLGYSNQELKVKALPTHKFRIGQITEIITALTAAKLIEDNKLNIDKPVAGYLPEMRQKKADFTIMQLAAHCSGLKADSTSQFEGNNNLKVKKDLSNLNNDLLFEPGTNFLYTETGFNLIGQIIEKSCNKRYYEVVNEIILDKLKLNNTVPDIFFRITENRSNTYDYNYVAQPMNASQVDLRGKEASIGYLSSALDLVRIGNVFLYPDFLKKDSKNLLITPFKLKNGQETQHSFGLIVSKDLKSRVFYGQRGSISGGSSALLIYPDDKLVIAITANIRSESWELPIFDIAEIFLNQLHPEKQKSIQVTK